MRLTAEHLHPHGWQPGQTLFSLSIYWIASTGLHQAARISEFEGGSIIIAMASFAFTFKSSLDGHIFGHIGTRAR
jgi:hypothetical protein